MNNSKWSNTCPAQKLMTKRFATGEFSNDTKPKDAWESSEEFQKYKLATFRVHFTKTKTRAGSNLGAMVSCKKERDDADDECGDDVIGFAEGGSPNKKRAILTEQANENAWFSPGGNWNCYLIAPWIHPTTGNKYVDIFILLPSGINHNSQYSINVEDCGLSVKLNLVWPNHFAKLATLTKIASIHDHEVTEMHPLVGGITAAFKDLKETINGNISQDYFIPLIDKVQNQIIFLKSVKPTGKDGKEVMSCIHMRLQGITDNFSNSVRDEGTIGTMTL